MSATARRRATSLARFCRTWLAGALALLLAACATERAPISPEARACLPVHTRGLNASNYQERLTAHRARADAFAACMREHGYQLDQDELERRLRRFEEVWNANQYNGDPSQALQIQREELRASPELWHPRS